MKLAPRDAHRPAPARPNIGPELSEWLAGALALAIVRSPFAKRRTWPMALAIVRSGESTRVTSRSTFAAWLDANDLRASARECRRRSVGPGEILVWIEADVPEVSTAGHFIFDLAKALRES